MNSDPRRREGRFVKFLKVFTFCFLFLACTEQPEYTWAFAQNMDGSFHKNEACRESLATSLYEGPSKEKAIRQATSNIYLFNGNIESYRIYGFKSQSECETALTNMKVRQSL